MMKTNVQDIDDITNTSNSEDHLIKCYNNELNTILRVQYIIFSLTQPETFSKKTKPNQHLEIAIHALNIFSICTEQLFHKWNFVCLCFLDQHSYKLHPCFKQGNMVTAASADETSAGEREVMQHMLQRGFPKLWTLSLFPSRGLRCTSWKVLLTANPA